MGLPIMVGVWVLMSCRRESNLLLELTLKEIQFYNGHSSFFFFTSPLKIAAAINQAVSETAHVLTLGHTYEQSILGAMNC